MEAFVVTWRELLIVVVAVLAISVVELLLLLRRSRARGRWWWSRGARASPEGASVDELLREISELRKQVARLQGEVEKLQAAPASISPYTAAIQMARQGASAGEVASGCGISRGEAELIVALYRKLRI
jgi:uncharacterized protein YlxW (UPF0749 family)